MSIDIAAQSDGQLLVTLGSYAGISITRLRTDGTTDTSFGINGWIGPSPSIGNYPEEVLVDSSDRVILQFRTSIVRLTKEGLIDLSFGVNGVWTAVPTGIVGTNLQPDGKILFSGYTYRGADALNYYIGRLDADGQADPQFTPFSGPSYGPMSEADNPVMQPDGRIILSNSVWTSISRNSTSRSSRYRTSPPLSP